LEGRRAGNMRYFVYALRGIKDRKLYVGYSENPERRLKQHNAGETKSLFRRRPLVLIYKEGFKNELEARRRERFLKSGQGRKFLKEVLR